MLRYSKLQFIQRLNSIVAIYKNQMNPQSLPISRSMMSFEKLIGFSRSSDHTVETPKGNLRKLLAKYPFF